MALAPIYWRVILALGFTSLAAAGYFGWQQYARPQPPSDNNNYEQPPAYPQQTANFSLQKRELFSDPMNGIGLRYQSRVKNGVQLDINLYPVGAMSWVNNPNLLDDEANVILADADYLIREHRWQERINTLREPIAINGQQGLRLHFALRQDNQFLFTVVDVFQAEDKFIKFTQHFSDLSPNALAQARENLQELLPQIHPPPESPYVHRLRQAHIEAMKKKVQMLLQSKNSDAKM